MNLEHLNYLVTVANCGSIHEASRQLLLKQQYISNVIKSLEEHFGVAIFERHSKGVTPTINGQYLIDHARQLLAIFNEMEASYQYPDNKKALTYTESITIYVPAYLDANLLVSAQEEFETYFPYVTVHIDSTKFGEDYSVLLDNPNHLILYPSNKSVQDFTQQLPANLTYQILEPISLMLFAAKSNIQAQKYSTISIEEALSLNLVMLTSESLDNLPIYQTIHSFGKPNIQYTVDNPIMLFRLMQKKNCFTIGKSTLLLGKDSILSIPFQESVFLNLYLIGHPDAFTSYTIQSLIRIMKKHQTISLNQCS